MTSRAFTISICGRVTIRQGWSTKLWREGLAARCTAPTLEGGWTTGENHTRVACLPPDFNEASGPTSSSVQPMREAIWMSLKPSCLASNKKSFPADEILPLCLGVQGGKRHVSEPRPEAFKHRSLETPRPGTRPTSTSQRPTLRVARTQLLTDRPTHPRIVSRRHSREPSCPIPHKLKYSIAPRPPWMNPGRTTRRSSPHEPISTRGSHRAAHTSPRGGSERPTARTSISLPKLLIRSSLRRNQWSIFETSWISSTDMDPSARTYTTHASHEGDTSPTPRSDNQCLWGIKAQGSTLGPACAQHKPRDGTRDPQVGEGEGLVRHPTPASARADPVQIQLLTCAIVYTLRSVGLSNSVSISCFVLRKPRLQ